MTRPRTKESTPKAVLPTYEDETESAKAVRLDPMLKEAHLKHLHRIEGQIRGIAAMVEDDRSCGEVITQVSAVRESLHTVARNIVRNHLKHCAAGADQRGGSERDQMLDELLRLVGKLSR